MTPRALLLIAALTAAAPASGHDIYTGVHGKNGQLCCGGDDCAATTYRIDRGHYLFKKRDGAEVQIPQDRITFLPIPGEDYSKANGAHLCYRPANETDRVNYPESVFDDIFLYCAFVIPGSI